MTDNTKHKQQVKDSFAFLRKQLDSEYHEACEQLEAAETLMARLGNKDVVIGKVEADPGKTKAPKKKRPSRAKTPAPTSASPTPAEA